MNKKVPITITRTTRRYGWVETAVNTYVVFVWDRMLALADKFMTDATQIDRIITADTQAEPGHDYVKEVKAEHTSFAKSKILSNESGRLVFSYHSKKLDSAAQIVFWNQTPIIFFSGS